MDVLKQCLFISTASLKGDTQGRTRRKIPSAVSTLIYSASCAAKVVGLVSLQQSLGTSVPFRAWALGALALMCQMMAYLVCWTAC